MPAIPVIPFVLMLTVVPLPLVPKRSDNLESALVKSGRPTDATNGPMYAELADGTINNKIKVFFKDYTLRYYYRLQTDNKTLSVTMVSIIVPPTMYITITCTCIHTAATIMLLFSLYRIQKKQPSFKCYLPQLANYTSKDNFILAMKALIQQ